MARDGGEVQGKGIFIWIMDSEISSNSFFCLSFCLSINLSFHLSILFYIFLNLLHSLWIQFLKIHSLSYSFTFLTKLFHFSVDVPLLVHIFNFLLFIVSSLYVLSSLLFCLLPFTGKLTNASKVLLAIELCLTYIYISLEMQD